MTDLKLIIAKNLTELRTAQQLTQLELAEKLNYTDKAISKWERGESIPDVMVLKQLADLYGVTVDYLLTEEHTKAMPHSRRILKNHGFITAICIILVWLLATLAFVVLQLTLKNTDKNWLAFIVAPPVSFVVWLVFNSIWFKKKRNFIIISLLMWSALAALFLMFLAFSINIWLVFLLGVPAQIIIIFWSRLVYGHNEQNK